MGAIYKAMLMALIIVAKERGVKHSLAPCSACPKLVSERGYLAEIREDKYLSANEQSPIH